jgi:hypothetical protein
VNQQPVAAKVLAALLERLGRFHMVVIGSRSGCLTGVCEWVLAHNG